MTEPVSEEPIAPTPAERRLARVAKSDTVGTGSALGIGCTLVTVAAIAVGILIFVVLRLL